MELVDTSVWIRQNDPRISEWWRQQMLAGEIAICDQVKLELLHSARNHSEFRSKRAGLDALPSCPTPANLWARIIDVYELLAEVSPQWHRSVKHADLVIAACAEAAGMTLDD
jgi:predicted nucleic acid-binding protein